MAAYMRSRVIGSDPFEVVAEAKLGGSRRSFGRGASLLASSLSAYPYTQSSRAGNLILSVANVPKGVDTDAIAEALTHKSGRGWFSAIGGAFSFELVSNAPQQSQFHEVEIEGRTLPLLAISYPLPCFMSSTEVIFDAFFRLRSNAPQ
ncbi:hypothetical protein SAMN02745225_00470 [Ferrithrix thermotolerans DSM 19514]|jgi:hypothetical protein|uniref:Uncharacterized protein n=1 Tax=Ferrithrix thermotolerans DSM 19514 TaxID=1121881 RepID=A0A1M4T2S9_9ACTN|nr:hypothetical protein [Ferrithrix thermotolerans]SHE38730.1 hypothetical protein SAMN02745225_00470 [Ferrithrix thermotolerans DSM 19514]